MRRRWLASLLLVGLALVLLGCQAWPAGLGIRLPSAEPAAPASTPSSSLPIASAPPPTEGQAPAATPTPVASPRPPKPLPEGVVPILYYHRVQAAPADFATLSKDARRSFLAYNTLPAALEAQLDWLAAHGYSTVLPRDLAAHWDHGAPLPPRPVVLTFDDGFSSWAATVLPALRARGMVAEFYLTLDAVRDGSITWTEVRRLAAAGNGIGAHDVHHVQLAQVPGKPAASAAVMWREISDIRSVIARHVGVAPDSMAYVGGGFDATLVRLVRQAGYTTARSIVRGVRQDAAHRYTLRVVRMGALDDVLDAVAGTMDPAMPVFAARIAGRELSP